MAAKIAASISAKLAFWSIHMWAHKYAAAVKIRSLDPARGWGQSRRGLIRVNSVLARANNRAISLAVRGKRLGETTVGCCGQRIMITCGIWGGLSNSTTMRSLPLRLPLRARFWGTILSRRAPSRRGPVSEFAPPGGPDQLGVGSPVSKSSRRYV
jgi:hypothetical protein